MSYINIYFIIYILYKTKISRTSKGIRVRETAQIVWSNQPGALYPHDASRFRCESSLLRLAAAWSHTRRRLSPVRCLLLWFKHFSPRAPFRARPARSLVPWLPCPTSATVLSITIVNLIGRGERKVSVSQLNDDRTLTPVRKTEIPVRRFRSFRTPLRSVRD